MPPVQQPAPASSPQPSPYSNVETNTIAIVGFILAFLFWSAGLICSIIGIKKAKQLSGKGHGLALAGIIISSLSLLMSIIAVVTILNAEPLPTQENSMNNDRGSNLDRRNDLALFRAQVYAWISNNGGKLPADNATLESIVGVTGWSHYNGNN